MIEDESTLIGEQARQAVLCWVRDNAPSTPNHPWTWKETTAEFFEDAIKDKEKL